MNKKDLRKFYKSVRHSLTVQEKSEFDRSIFVRLINSDLFKKSSGVLTYVSIPEEPDTLNLIEFCLKNGKEVGVPFCKNDKMLFYRLDSLDNLINGKFNIPTVDPLKSAEIIDFSSFICLVPGVCFDKSGERIGYGGGYYDRFLAVNNVASVGLCYERCVCSELPSESYDINTEYILTEQKMIKCKKQGGFYI